MLFLSSMIKPFNKRILLILLKKDISIIITQMTSLSEIHGIDVSEMGVIRLENKTFSSIDLQKFPPHREHFLIHALQFQRKLPSEASMIRSEIRNGRKSGLDAANAKTGRPARVIINPKKQRSSFIVPAKSIPIVETMFKKRKRAYVKRSKKFAAVPLVTKRKTRTTPRAKRNAIKIYSPASLALKGARVAIKAELEQLRKLVPPTITKELDDTPLYFKKKKANQKRRRQEKHALIKKNRKALQQIYGQAIYQSGWPVGIKQIKEVLGIKEKDHLLESVQGLADLVKETQA